ncbi:hypothetical protein TNCV_109651 [Trichonephila clavipes]|nr:hypothetical protein TNCV_109651 [Trichonephila clavipes]
MWLGLPGSTVFSSEKFPIYSECVVRKGEQKSFQIRRGQTWLRDANISLLELWLTDWKIKVNASKSACLMFTRSRLPVGLTPVTIFGQPVPWAPLTFMIWDGGSLREPYAQQQRTPSSTVFSRFGLPI